MKNFIENFADQIIHKGWASRSEIIGCSDDEIIALEQSFEIRLPDIYKSFLKIMGWGAGSFMDGTDFFYRSLFENRNALIEVLNLDQQPFVLAQDIFVFSNHQGYIFHFFETRNDNPDPCVYGYKEGEGKTKVVADTFSEFLILEEGQ